MSSTDNAPPDLSILYEMAMAIGNSNNTQVMLKAALTTMMKKLDGVASAVVTHSGRTLSVFPRRGFSKAYYQPLAALGPTDEYGLRSHHQIHGSECYYFDLPQSGTLIFVKRTPLNATLLKMLGPICQKLDLSVDACLAVEALQTNEQKLSDSLQALEIAQEAKDRFLANMSHEIRTPLNGILGFIDQLAQTPLETEQTHFVDIIQQSSHTLLGVINDILDFSKIESGQMQLDKHPFQLYTELSPAIELFKCRASEKNLLLKVAFDPDCDMRVCGDNLRIKQVMSNLVSNAIKFTESGQVQVQVRVLERSPTHCQLQFSVQDTGIGMTPAQLAHIFDPFTQADKSTTRTHGGSGLGLSISHQLVALMGGELKVESQPNQGTCFYFDLTLPIDHSAQNPSDAQPSHWDFDFQDRLLLLVEDNQVNQLLMQAILKKMGLAFELAEDGQQAVDLCRQHRFDLVLMDINMPVMDGVEAFQTIQTLYQDGTIAYTPVVALTANALVGDCERYQNLGMQDCLTKPLDMQALTRVLNETFR